MTLLEISQKAAFPKLPPKRRSSAGCVKNDSVTENVINAVSHWLNPDSLLDLCNPAELGA